MSAENQRHFEDTAIDDELPGYLVGIANRHRPGFELALAERPARLRMCQPGQLDRERQQRHELLHLGLLPVDVGGHGCPFTSGPESGKMRSS